MNSELLPHSIHTLFLRNLKWLCITQICILFLSIQAGVAEITAQKASFRKYSVLDGLPQSQVIHIVQDSRGFLWISTRNGLSRFDGIEFVNYFRNNGLPDNQSICVFEDNNMKLYSLSVSGLSVYNGNGFNYYRPSPEFGERGFMHAATVDSANNIFLTGVRKSDNSKRIILFRNGEYSDYSVNFPVLDTLKIIDCLFDRSEGGLVILDRYKTTWLWKRGRLSAISSGKFDNIDFRFNDVTSLSGDTTYNLDNGRFKVYDYMTSDGKHGIIRDSTSPKGEFRIFNGKESYNIDLPFTFLNYWIDNENVMWFSTEGNMYRMLSPAFSIIGDEEIKKGNTWAIAEDRNGKVFFGTVNSTLTEFDGSSFSERNEFRSLFKSKVCFYKGSRRMSNGDVWFSTNTGVLIWDGSSFSVLQGPTMNCQICYIYEDPDNRTIMIGTEKGLFILRNNTTEQLPEFNDKELGVIEGVTKDDSGVYWLSGHKGLVKFDGKSRVPVREQVLPEEFTYTIEKDFAGGLWVTSETGLYFRRNSSSEFIHGLPESINAPANSIIRMDRDHILLGRLNDICLIDLKKFYSGGKDYFRLYDSTDGFMGSDCLDNGIIRDWRGRFWIMASDNIVILDPGRLLKILRPPKLNITGFQFENDSLTWKTVDTTNFFYRIPPTIKLKNFQNTIRISFNGISTANPEKVLLQYRLEGYDGKWSLPSTKRSVIYEKLPPGHYRFMLKAFNADGIETPQPLTIEITVVPTIWQLAVFRIFFYIIFTVLLVSVILFLIRRRMRRKEEESRMRNELSRLQMNSVLRQFDPHFTFNVISAIGSLIMRGEKENAYDYITILGGLLRTVLGEGAVIIKPLSEEIEFVNRYCELQKLRFNDRINFSMEIGENVNLKRSIPKMTIQLFVENAIKHGFEDRTEGGKVDVRITKNIDSMEISIIDNGIGRMAASMQMKDGSGTGLKMITGLFEVTNSHNRADSTIEIIDLEENGIARGTSVRILIPDDYRFESGHPDIARQN